MITYLDDVKNVRKAKSEEEALQIVSSACDGMHAVLKSVDVSSLGGSLIGRAVGDKVTLRPQLDPSSHATTKDRWKKAEEYKKDFKTMVVVLPGTNATEQEPPIPVGVGISVGAKELAVQQTQQLCKQNNFYRIVIWC